MGRWLATDGAYVTDDSVEIGHVAAPDGFLDLARTPDGLGALTFIYRAETPAAQRAAEVLVIDSGNLFLCCEEAFKQGGITMTDHRTSYLLKGTRFELDKYHGSYSHIPEFLEIEGTDTETVYRYAEDLGFSRLDCKPCDATELAAFYTGREKTQ